MNALAPSSPPAPEAPALPQRERRFEIDRDGRVELPGSVVRALRLFRAEPFLAFPGGRNWVHLLRAEGAPAALARAERIALSGELEEVGIADVFSMLNMARQSGMLLVFEDSTYKAVHFRRGEIVFAESGRPEDRLGQVLYRTGKLTGEGLLVAEANAKPGRRFGATLLDLALLSPSDLQWGVRYQIEEIVYSIFRLSQGRFVFLRGTFVDPDLATLAIDTNGVLLEAYQRVDELGLITAHIRGRETILLLTGGEPPLGSLPDRLQRALALVDGRRRVEEIVRALGWGEFSTFKALYELLKRGLVEPESASRPGAAEAEDPRIVEARPVVDSYNRAFLLVQDVLRAKRLPVDLGLVLESYLRSAPDPARSILHGASLRSSRRWSAEPLIENARAYAQGEADLEARGDAVERVDPPGKDRTLQLLVEALEAWRSHLRLLVFNLLPEAEAEELASYVAAILRGAAGSGDEA